MKKGLIVMFMGATLILGACGNSEDASSGNTNTNANASEHQKQEEPKEKEAAKGDDNTTLDTIGEVEDHDGVKAELLGLWNEGQAVHDGDFSVTLNSVKLIEFQEMDEEFRQGIMMMGGMDDLEIPAQYLQVDYTVQNNTENAVWWNDIDHILYGKKQIDVMMNDFIHTDEEPTDTILAGTEYNGTVGVIVPDSDAENVKLSFSTIYQEGDSMAIVEETKELDVSLNR